MDNTKTLFGGYNSPFKIIFVPSRVHEVKKHPRCYTHSFNDGLLLTDELLTTHFFWSLCEKWGVTVIEFNGEDNHIHLLFSYYPQIQLSKFINKLKTVTSVKANEEFSEHLARFFWKSAANNKGEFWNDSYAIESVGGANIEVLERYIRNQNAPKC